MDSTVLERGDRVISYRTSGGGDDVVMLVHGWPQTGLCWRHVVPLLADRFTVVVPDLRGYGGSQGRRTLDVDKRAVSEDLRELMRHLGRESVFLAGHDRGARVAHRWALDHPAEVRKLAILDVLPTREVLAAVDAATAPDLWHWFFHQRPDFPELLLEGRAGAYVRTFLGPAARAGAIDEATMLAYVDAFDSSPPDGWLGDYRASFGIDRERDDRDFRDGRKVEPPLLALWGGAGQLGGQDVIAIWRDYAKDVRGASFAGCGHYLPEERPDDVGAALRSFFTAST